MKASRPRLLSLRPSRPWFLAPLVAVAFVVTGCSSLPAPKVQVKCTAEKISVRITNESEKAARYVVSIEIRTDIMTSEESFSTNDVAPGKTVTQEEDRVGDPGDTCVVVSAKAYEGTGKS